MKAKKLTAALMAFGLAGTGGLAIAGDLSNPEGPAPQLTRSEEGALILAETLLSITAGLISTGAGCEGLEGVYPFLVAVQINGDGYAKYPSNQVNGIRLDVIRGDSVLFFGTKYEVQQDPFGERQYLNKESIRNFDGDFAYSEGGAILLSNSYFDIYEFDTPFPWDEHNIKDFWLEVEAVANPGIRVNTAHIEDSGLEVITKDDYPISKWRQESDHYRWNFDLGPGELTAEKQLITPYNVSDCTISIVADVNNALGVTTIIGEIEVEAKDF